MKKLFISCPMSGRTDENIKESMNKLHRIAESIAGEELEVIDTFLEGAEYNDKPLMCLGESIKRMQDADYFIGPDDCYSWRGCHAERALAIDYGVKILDLSVFSLMPDAAEVLERRNANAVGPLIPLN